MFFWFIGTAILTVGFVFGDPRFDYRLLIVGSVVPLLDGFFGGAGVLHSLAASVALLTAIMMFTAGRKPVRRMLLGLPIGMFLHLVFDGAWADTATFWWPFSGASLAENPLPVVERGWLSAVLEVGGLVVCGYLWRRNQLGDPVHRRQALATGRLVVAPERPR